MRIYIDDDRAARARGAGRRAAERAAVAPFAPPLAHVTARGHNLYFPFPFARRCVVTVDDIVSPDPFTGRPIAKLYYQIGYRRYRPEQAARVRPYSPQELARAAPTIARVATVLRDGPPADPAPTRPRAPSRSPPRPSTPAIPRSPASPRPPGGGALTELRIATRERTPQTLRSTRLSIAFDGETTVDAPLIDFFGTGPGLEHLYAPSPSPSRATICWSAGSGCRSRSRPS